MVRSRLRVASKGRGHITAAFAVTVSLNTGALPSADTGNNLKATRVANLSETRDENP